MSSILSGYEYDVFISYRQNDNQGGWVTRFAESLEREIRSIFKEEISVYFDVDPQHGLHETHDVDGSLKEKVKCLVFIPIISQTYCDPNSFAWQKEFLPFLEFSKSDSHGLDIKVPGGNVSKRVLPIRIHDIDNEDKRLFENEIGGVMRPVDFIYKESGVNRPLHKDDKEETNLNKTNYRNQINKVANAVKEIIHGMTHNSSVEETKYKSEVIKQSQKTKGKRIVAIISLMVVMAFLFSYFAYKATKSTTGEIVERSIAVLPFVNMSRDEDNKYFSDGMQDAVLDHLSKIGELRVISRSSMEQYRETTKTVPEIAKEVSVNYILEGSVQRSNDKVRITVQLIQAQNDKHIWSQEYDRELKDVFEIQSEIAEEVASRLNAIINPTTKASVETIPTDNMEAYEFYLRGKDIENEARNDDDIIKARYYYQKAIDAQPDFALAYLGVSSTYYSTMGRELNNYKESMDTVLSIIDKAISLDPQLSEGYLYKGWFYSNGIYDREKAITNFEKAIELKPNDPQPYRLLAELYSISPPVDFVKSFYYASKALSVVKGEDLPGVLDRIGYIYLSLGDYEKTDSIYNVAADITPSWQANSARWWLNVVQGNYQKALEYSQKNYELYPDSRKSILELARTYTYLGDYDQALKYFDLWHNAKDSNSLDRVQYVIFNNEYYYVLLKTGKEDVAKKKIKEQIKQTKTNIKLTQNSADGGYYFDLIQLYSMLGERDSTLVYLRKMETNEFPWGSLGFLASCPLTSNFNRDPEYQKTIERAWKTKFEQMDNIKKQEINQELRRSLSK